MVSCKEVLEACGFECPDVSIISFRQTDSPGSPGLVVMGEDPCLDGHGFKSQRHILDGHFFTFICSKNFNVCSKSRK